MPDNKDDLLIKALTAIIEGHKEILAELKSLKDKPKEDLVPIRMPDGSTNFVPRSSLQASTQQNESAGKMTIVDNPNALTKDPWPDPSIPRPKVVRIT